MEYGYDSHRILVAEDDSRLREGMIGLLQAWGYETETASDGFEALEKIRSFDPALIISDLRMPHMGGLELLKELRHEFRSLDCIVISGQASLEEEFEAIRLGAFSLLQKPIYPEQLKTEVRRCLGKPERLTA